MNEHDERGLRRGLTSYGDRDFSLFLRRAFLKASGYGDEALARTIVGVVNTASGFNSCHGNAGALVAAVRRGVERAGGVPIEFPTISLHESFAHPTSMYLRNLMAMDTEEMIRAQPMDAVVLIGGCDKTVPAQIMGASSAGVPAIQVVSGSMQTGMHAGERIGACTDCRRFWAMYRAGQIDEREINQVCGELVGSVGTCSVMGTASTMACVVEALGMMLPGGASPPATSPERVGIAEASGAQAVRLAEAKLTPDRIMTPRAFENALRVLLAVGGSTNGLIHLTAMAGRLGIGIDLDAFDRMGRETPLLVDLKPSGCGYMEDFHKAGGMPVVLRELQSQLHLDCMTVTGQTLGEQLTGVTATARDEVIRTANRPVYPGEGIVVLRGNLAPRGAILKQSAASKDLLEHEGRAVVFENAEDLASRIDDPALNVAKDDVLVLKRIGPLGAPGMPEAGAIPIPKKLARAGVKDMVRISDGRMSGTAGGTIVLHVTPEAALGGPLAAVQTGDRVRLSVAERSLSLLVGDSEMQRRLAQIRPSPPADERGYRKLFLRSVTQADEGCDFDFLRPAIRETVPKAGKR